jgi:DHA3 family tetracycline resistance protein-like MFS transporter
LKRLNAYPIYLLMTAVSTFSFSLAFTTSAVYRYESAGLNPLQLILLGTALEGAVFLFEVPTGVVADLYSRRLSVIIGFTLIGAGMILEGSIAAFWPILLAQIIWGIGYTFISGAQDAWLADELGEEGLTAVYLRGSQVDMLAALAGILANIVVAGRQLNLPFFAGGIGHLGLALFLALFMSEHGFTPTPRGERETWRSMGRTFQTGMTAIRQRPLLTTMMVIALVYGLYSEALDRLWQPHLLENFAFPAVGALQPVAWFGLIRAAVFIIAIATTEIMRRRAASLSQARMATLLAIMTAIMALGMILFGLVQGFVLAVAAYLLVAVTRATLGPLYNGWTNQGIPSEVRATVLSTLGQMDAIGQVAGGPFLGVVATRLGMRAAMAGSGLLLLPLLPLYRRAREQAPPRPAAAPAD